MTDIQALINRGGTVVLPPGTHRVRNLRIPHGTTVDGRGQATLEGSLVVPSTSWLPEGNLRHCTYRPMPVKDGLGITFSTGQNLNDRLGKYADQVWTRASGDTRLRRVDAKSKVTPGRFYIGGGTLWVHKDDAAKGILTSGSQAAVSDLSGTLKGVTIARYSPTPADGAAVIMKSGGRLEEVTIDSCSFVSVSIPGGSGQVLKRVTIRRAGWMGVSATLADRVTLDGCVFDKINDWGVFADSPQSGAVKTSRVRNINIVGCTVTSSKGHGLWFDQSTLDAAVTDTAVTTAGRALFFEISAGLTVTGCRLTGKEGMRVAGGSGVRVRRTTLTGISESALGVFVDPRGHYGWSNPRTQITSEMRRVAPYIASDRQSESRWTSRLTWQPEIVEFIESQMRPPHGKQALTVDLDSGSLSVPESKVFPHGRPRNDTPGQPEVRLANLRYGLTNDDVKDLQNALNRSHGHHLLVDGNYGNATDTAVRKCQHDHDFGEDAPQHSFIGSRQAAHFGLRVV